MSHEQCEHHYNEAVRIFKTLPGLLRELEQGNVLLLSGLDHDGKPPSDLQMQRTRQAAILAIELADAVYLMRAHLDKLWWTMNCMQDEAETEIITDEDQHPGCNNASTWL